MSLLIEKMLIEEDSQLTPQLKKMKLSSTNDSQTAELTRSNYFPNNPEDHLKVVFPHFSEEVKFTLNIPFRNYSKFLKNLHTISSRLKK
jgi:hypothetical protein